MMLKACSVIVECFWLLIIGVILYTLLNSCENNPEFAREPQ